MNQVLFFNMCRSYNIINLDFFTYLENTLDCKDNTNCHTDNFGLYTVNIFLRHIPCPGYIWHCNPILFEKIKHSVQILNIKKKMRDRYIFSIISFFVYDQMRNL